MPMFNVLSPLKSGGKIREIGECVELDEKVAAALRPGSVELCATKAEPKPAAVKPEPKPAAAKKK